MLKTVSWTYRIKDSNGEKIIESFYEKGLLLSKLKMSYYPGPNSHIRDEVLFKFSNYANKKCSRCFKQLKKNKKNR